MSSREYREFVACFAAHEVEYLVVGAFAVGFYARPRATKDLDLWVKPAVDNAARVIAAVGEFFGGFDFGLKVADLSTPGRIVQLGVAPARVDLLTSVGGLSWAEAWAARVEGDLDGVSAYYLPLDALITSKEVAGRPQDLFDLSALRRAKQKRGRS